MGFQLCYDLGAGEHALTWRDGGGFVHSKIDTGEDTAFANCTPILEPDGHGPLPWKDIARLFNQRSRTLEPALQGLIRDRLARHAGPVTDSGRSGL
jgi:hypothetical protein